MSRLGRRVSSPPAGHKPWPDFSIILWLIGLVHLVTLGWITLSILGAIYIVGMSLGDDRLSHLIAALSVRKCTLRAIR